MKTKLYPLVLINIIILTISGCKSHEMIIYSYSDGNNNTYEIKKWELAYKPVTPIESSSGTYSGGQPKTIKLTQADYDKVIDILNKAIEDKSMHIDERVMMSGMIRVEKKGGNQFYILGARSQSKYEIEKLLKEILERNK